MEVALALFLVWSNSFVAASYLLGSERVAARFDWVGLAVARFAFISPICLGWCLLWRRREALGLLRRHRRRLLAGALLAVPCYNLALYYGQQHGVPRIVSKPAAAGAQSFGLGGAGAGSGACRPARALGWLSR